MLHSNEHQVGRIVCKARSAMESGRSLAQVISEMHSEIRKLESENKALRGQLGRTVSDPDSARPVPITAASQQKDGSQEILTHTSLRRNLSAPALEGQYRENIIMTVRRYSISSNTVNSPRKNEISHKPGHCEVTLNNNKWTKLHDGLHGRPSRAYTKPDVDKLNNRHSILEYGNKNRGKDKTVTFLLPVDDIYTNQPALAEHLPACTLNAIAETDS